MKEKISFNDVLLEPRYSEVESRSQVSTSVILYSKTNQKFEFNNPIIPANMQHISDIEMCKEMYKLKSLCLFHRFNSIEHNKDVPTNYLYFTNHLKKIGSDIFNYIGFSVGVKEDDKTYVDNLYKVGVRIICIDIAHAHSKLGIEMTKYVADKYPDILLISGNVATSAGAFSLWSAGADVVKVNIGAGSICTTRVETANGVPQLSALMDVYNELSLNQNQNKITGRKNYIIADGGMSQAGHLVIALGFADMVMTGNLLAGSDECPGNIITKDSVKYKEYFGSSTHKNFHVEGVKAYVKTKGYVKDVVENLLYGIKSGCSYQGVFSISDLKKVVGSSLIRITNSGYIESKDHDVVLL